MTPTNNSESNAAAPPAGKRRFVIVTGPGRSGTSAVARVLHESGVELGRDLAPPTEHNRAGFYEELPVVDLNDEVMADLGMTTIAGWTDRSSVLAAAAPYAGRMRELAVAAADGWKDPRFCLLLEAWLPHLPAPPKIVVCLRSPEAFIHSVISIFGLASREQLEAWWSNHHLRVLEVIRHYRLQATCVRYEDLIAEPERTVAALASFIGSPLDARYVEPALQRHAQPVPERHAALFREVQALASAPSVRR